MTGSVLVTGYGGFIGRHLCRRLQSEGYTVTGADLKDAKVPGVRHAALDITDPSGFRNLPKDVDCVIHLAAVSFVPKAGADYVKTYDVNVKGTYDLLRYFAKSGGKRFIFASSAKVYGTPKRLPIDENHPLAPDSVYGRSKRAAEGLVEAFSAEGGSFTVFRQFNVYGPGQSEDFFVPTVLRQLQAGDGLRLGDIDVKRDFLYVDDLVDAYVRVLSGGKDGLTVYNIGGGESILLRDVVESAAELYGRKPKITVEEGKVRSEAKDVCSDNGKIRKTGWQPKTSLIDGLRKTKDSFR